MVKLQKAYIKRMRANLHAYALKRRETIKTCGDALHCAKRAVFALHRDDIKEAEAKLNECEEGFNFLNKKYKNDKSIQSEGSYKEALEEYVEASLFFQFVTDRKIGEVKKIDVDDEVYLAGLCDVPGELHRYAIKAATKKDVKTAKLCSEMGNEIIGELIEFDLTKYLRTKFDQAKQAVRKLEVVVYELSLKE